MRRMKRLVAVAIATVMVIGCSLSAFADPVTSGGTDGAGTSEGHVEKKLINVILPTVPADSTPFAYTMDPEGLIQETNAAKYAEGTTFPAKESDTHVYFLVADKTYANTSNVLQAINMSSCNITLTVKVKATQNTAKDIALATSSTVATTGTPDLYLGLKVGKGDPTVVSASEQTVAKTLAGVEDNFEIAVATAQDGTKSYVYQQKESATDWKAIELSMTGAVSNLAIASDTTAPTVNVTWSYAEAASTASVDTADQVTYSTAPTTYTVTYNANYIADDAEEAATATETVNVGSNPTGPATAFTREGYTFAGWSTSATGEAVALNTIEAATTLYALWTEDDAAPSITTTSITYSKANGATISGVSLGGGELAATGVTSIEVVSSANAAAGTGYTIPSGWSYDSGEITLPAGLCGSAAAGNNRYFIVTFSENTSVVITATIAD